MIIPLYLCKRTLPVICLLTITVQTSFAQTVYTYSCKAYNTYFRGIPSTDKECNYTVKHLVYEDGRMDMIFDDKNVQDSFNIEWLGMIDSGDMLDMTVLQWAGYRKDVSPDIPFVVQLILYPAKNSGMFTIKYSEREMITYDLRLLNTQVEKK